MYFTVATINQHSSILRETTCLKVVKKMHSRGHKHQTTTTETTTTSDACIPSLPAIDTLEIEMTRITRHY